MTRKRKRRPDLLDDRDQGLIEGLLTSGAEKPLIQMKRKKGFRRTLKRFVREHPEQFRAECPGAVSLLLAAQAQNRRQTTHLDLHRFKNLSGDQVVELVMAVVALNVKRTKSEASPKPLAVLDISFIASVTSAHVARILDFTDIDELLAWDNPDLRLEEVAQVAKGRITKTTARTLFLEPLERWILHGARWHDGGRLEVKPSLLKAPTRTRIRQVVWMTVVTLNVDPKRSLERRPGTLSLEQLTPETLATILHPRYRRIARPRGDRSSVFAELVALPQCDVWSPLAEFYTSLARVEKFMADDQIVRRGHRVIMDRWPLIFPLMMATGNAKVGRGASCCLCLSSFLFTCSPLHLFAT